MASCLTIEREAVDLSDYCLTAGYVPRNCLSIFRELDLGTKAH